MGHFCRYCGSGRAYWDCCADRDDEAAASVFPAFLDWDELDDIPW